MKSIIAKRMMPSFDPTTVRGTYRYPGYDLREIFLVRDLVPKRLFAFHFSERGIEWHYTFNPDTDPYDIVAEGYFTNVKDDLTEPNALWLPDCNGACRITANDAPYNKTLGYIRFTDGCMDQSRLDEDYYILGLNTPLKVTLDYLRRT